MSRALIDGIATEYEVLGEGPPLLMYSPGGLDAAMEKWRTQGIYRDLQMLDYLPDRYRCILFDRRESGNSGGRIERVSWADYARQGAALLDHLGIDSAHLLGGCMGCSAVLAFAIAYPRRARSMVLFWPVGGARYRLQTQQRFAEHLAFARSAGLAEVVELARSEGKSFSADPRVGPWASVLRIDDDFATAYRAQDLSQYGQLIMGLSRTLVDRDTAPGGEPEDLLRLDIPALVVPGDDASHATSAARYLAECLPRAEYWDTPVTGQTASATASRIETFLAHQSDRRQ